MPLHRLKAWYYALTALNTLATQYYFNYLFFFLRDRFGFGNRENLEVAALHGSLYIVSAWNGGRFAEKHGYATSLLIGFGGLAVVIALGGVAPSASAELLVLAAYTGVLLFTWPALEALAVQHEPRGRVPRMIGIYNCTWSAAAAVAYFTGGALYDALGTGLVFWIPVTLCLGQLAVTAWLARQEPDLRLAQPAARPDPIEHRPALRVPPETFRTLAWMANPFSYVAVYTLLAVMPGLGARFGLSPAGVGLFCSVWFFGRLAAFAILWHWTGWHYRFGWLVAGYLLLAACFVSILTAPALWLVVAAEVGFGAAAGLLYYSSIFYALDLGEAKAEHGGLHEAAIGAGIFAGPAVGALSLSWFPGAPHASAVAVGALLLAGLVALMGIWTRARLAGPTRMARVR
jgi:predicted MFS family arabinose efflux permease